MDVTSNGDNITSDKKDDVQRQRPVLLVVLLCVGTVVLAVALQGIIYPTDDSIDTSLREPTRIREKAAVPLSTDSDDDQVTSVELLKVSVQHSSVFCMLFLTQSTKFQILRSPVCMEMRMI